MRLIKEQFDAQMVSAVKTEIKRLKQQNRFNRQRIKELKDKLK